MPRLHLPRSLSLVLLLTLLLPNPAHADGPPVIVAVDTSRSLDPAALGEVVDRLRLALQDLPADAPAGLVAFDDEPRWLVETGATPAEVASALQELTLQGNFTLLHDALFVATRALEEGGVILLATDGRDENSATTVDDIARRCEAQGVRILSVGTGRAVEERALRRLALVSSGEYLGDVRTVDASQVAEAVSRARDAVAGERAERLQREQAERTGTPVGTRPAETGAQGEQEAGGDATHTDSLWGWLLPWGIAGLSLLVVLLLVRRQRREPADEDRETGAGNLDEEEEDQRSADVAEAEVIRLELAQAEAAEPREAPEVTVDTTVFQEMSLEDRLERTRVLSNEGVLVMKRTGEPPRSFLLDSEKAFAVGRDPDENTLAVPDPSISSQHFKIVPRDGAYYLVDLGSTNGSYVGGRPVNAKRLRAGDVIRAGQVEFEFQNYSSV